MTRLVLRTERKVMAASFTAEEAKSIVDGIGLDNLPYTFKDDDEVMRFNRGAVSIYLWEGYTLKFEEWK